MLGTFTAFFFKALWACRQIELFLLLDRETQAECMASLRPLTSISFPVPKLNLFCP